MNRLLSSTVVCSPCLRIVFVVVTPHALRTRNCRAAVQAAFPNSSVTTAWVSAGEVLFMPAYTLHTVSAGEHDGLSVSANVFSAAPESAVSRKMISAG